MIRRLIILLLIVGCVFAREYIAINDFEGIGVSDDEAKILSQRLTSEMIALEVYQIIERKEMKRLLDEQKFQYSGCVDTKCAVEIGKMLGAKYMVVGTVSKLGSTYSLESRLINVETSEAYISASFVHSGKIDVLLTNGISSVAKQLCGLEEIKTMMQAASQSKQIIKTPESTNKIPNKKTSFPNEKSNPSGLSVYSGGILSNMSGKETYTRTGAEYGISYNNLPIILGIQYSQRGFSDTSSVGDVKYILDYLSFLALYPYSIGSGRILGGFVVGNSLNPSEIINQSDGHNISNNIEGINDLEYGITLVIQYPIMEDIVLNAGYYYGLSNVFTNQSSSSQQTNHPYRYYTLKHRGLSLHLNWFFPKYFFRFDL